MDLVFTYKNWKGEIRERRVMQPLIWEGVTEHHPERQHFIKAIDIEKNEIRDFAVRDMSNIRSENGQSPAHK